MWRNRDAWSVRTKRSGFKFAPILHWLFAAQWWGMTPKEFADLDGQEQSLAVAAFDAHNQISAIEAEQSRKGSEGPAGDKNRPRTAASVARQFSED